MAKSKNRPKGKPPAPKAEESKVEPGADKQLSRKETIHGINAARRAKQKKDGQAARKAKATKPASTAGQSEAASKE